MSMCVPIEMLRAGVVLVAHHCVQHLLMYIILAQQLCDLTRIELGLVAPAVDADDAITDVLRPSKCELMCVDTGSAGCRGTSGRGLLKLTAPCVRGCSDAMLLLVRGHLQARAPAEGAR